VEELAPLRLRLEDAGLERVRVGLRGDAPRRELVVEYENHRYAQNEADALGLALGWGAELAPAGVRHVRAITLKDGLRVYETRVDASAYRVFLREGSAAAVRADLTWQSGSSGASDSTRWERDAPSRASRLRFEVNPDLNYTLGTEVGAFDYTLAGRARLVAPLWTGARLTSDYLVPIDHSLNMNDGRAFSNYRQDMGLENLSLGQSFWVGRRILIHGAAGRFHFDAWGVQSEAEAFVPGTYDVVRLKGAFYSPEPGGLEGGDRAGAISYRHLWGPENWTEIGWQRYSDGTSGPSLEWTRWSSDIGVTLFGRWGGDTRFVGLKLTVPLTPRRGMKPYAATLAGPGQYSQSIRTMLVTDDGVNQVQPSWVRDLVLETDMEREMLNSGRMSELYLKSQLHRMREAFYLFGGDGRL
jgi:hypothetical protein